jgi:Zn-dependent peptidase ImmA (M78 family)
MTRPDDAYLSANQLKTVERHAARLLEDASALGVFPTPIDRLMEAAKLTVVDDSFLNDNVIAQFIRKAKASLTSNIKSALSKVLGLIHLPERLVLIDKDMPAPKRPFIKLHEAGHGTLPHQSKVYSLIHDCEKTLDPDITDLFEREANVFAAEVLFQGVLFAEEAHQSAFALKVPLALASKYGASKYSTFRRYISTNPSACCVIVLEPVISGPDKQFSAQIRRVIASTTFHVNFDCLAFGPAISHAHLLGHMVPIGKTMTGRRNIKLADRNGERRNCTAEAFDSTHQIFILIQDLGLSSSKIILPSAVASVQVRSGLPRP